MSNTAPARPGPSPILAKTADCWRRLDSAAGTRLACWLMPLMFGLLSVLLGQDDNWDLHNYHLYNAYALLHGKIGLDLAPGQWQSYFNPTLDVLYYGLVMHLPGPLTCFIMGALHGLHFPLLMALGTQLLPAAADGRPPQRLRLLLALAGCLGPAFLSGLGNSMGDNVTGLFVLGALLLVLRHWPRLVAGGARAWTSAVLTGVLTGLGTGLKLTNASYCVGLCLALLALDAGWRVRVGAAFSFGCGVLAGIAASAGHWFWRMYVVFGNPLFPQFNDYFRAPLAAPIGIGDTGWLPKGWGEKILWPFIFTLHPQRVCELPLRDLIWPMLYLAMLALGWSVLRTPRGQAVAPLAPRSRVLMTFVAASYLVWLNLFSLYRYLLPLEMIAPLTFWLLAARLAPQPAARRYAGAALALAACSLLSWSSWGHAGRAWNGYTVQTPALTDPAASMVFTVEGDPPMAWLVPFFPDTLAFVSLGAGFPESDRYRQRVADMRLSRKGPLYVMLSADRQDPHVRRSEAQRLQAVEHDAQVLQRASATLAAYGMRLDGACHGYVALAARVHWDYRMCPVAGMVPPA